MTGGGLLDPESPENKKIIGHLSFFSHVILVVYSYLLYRPWDFFIPPVGSVIFFLSSSLQNSFCGEGGLMRFFHPRYEGFFFFFLLLLFKIVFGEGSSWDFFVLGVVAFLFFSLQNSSGGEGGLLIGSFHTRYK